jgi:penicillin-binding protein 1C
VLNLPVQTAAKTGTSTDYRDAWAVGYNYRYVVGIWMGNLDQTPTDGVTGSTGPSLALRAMFAELNRHAQTQRLPLNRQLAAQEICLPAAGQRASGDCIKRTEYFLPGHPWQETPSPASPAKLEITRPTMGLQMAYDPRIPAELQAFRWEVSGMPEGAEIEWFLNGQREARTTSPHYLWPVTQGKYELLVIAHLPDGNVEKTGPVSFIVK